MNAYNTKYIDLIEDAQMIIATARNRLTTKCRESDKKIIDDLNIAIKLLGEGIDG